MRLLHVNLSTAGMTWYLTNFLTFAEIDDYKPTLMMIYFLLLFLSYSCVIVTLGQTTNQLENVVITSEKKKT